LQKIAPELRKVTSNAANSGGVASSEMTQAIRLWSLLVHLLGPVSSPHAP
jgi:hypothetical protein